MTDNTSGPDERMLRVNAAVDDELDAANLLELENEMRADPALAAEYRLIAATREAIRRHAPRETAPLALAERVAALASAEAKTDAALRTGAPIEERPPVIFRFARGARGAPDRRARWSGAQALALAASLGVLGFAAGVGLTAFRLQSATGGVAAAGLVSDFARAEISGQPFDVASSDRHTVKPWLAARATVSPAIVDLASQGFELAGGRIAIVDRIPAPTLVYRKREHLIAVTELPAGSAGGRGNGAIETIDGFHVARWSDGSLSYVAVSDIDEQELAHFVETFRQTRSRSPEGTGG